MRAIIFCENALASSPTSRASAKPRDRGWTLHVRLCKLESVTFPDRDVHVHVAVHEGEPMPVPLISRAGYSRGAINLVVRFPRTWRRARRQLRTKRSTFEF